MPSEHGSIDDLCDRVTELTNAVRNFDARLCIVGRMVERHDEDIRGNGHPGLKAQIAALQAAMVPELKTRLARVEDGHKERRGLWKEIRGALIGAVIATAISLAAVKLGAAEVPAASAHGP